MFSVCKWKDAFSAPFSVVSGVRQGGVLSAKFWAVYMDDLILQLSQTSKGCHVHGLYLACILYADDVCLLTPSRKSLQVLMDVCANYANTWCIRYNERKTKLMYYGKDFNSFSCAPVFLNGQPLQFVTEWKYLGVVLISDKHFICSAKKPWASFFRSSNTILNVLRKPSEPVLMKLLYTICVPNITYSCEVAVYNSREMDGLHVLVNSGEKDLLFQQMGEHQVPA